MKSTAPPDLRHDVSAKRTAWPLLLSVPLVWVLALAACATPARPPASTTAPEAYRIGAGDELRVRVHPEPGFSRRLKVRSDGAISVDMIGDVRAADRRPDEVAREIESRLGEFVRHARVTVAVEQPSSRLVSVLGEVKAPTVFALERETRVIDAIARAGDATELAATSRVRLFRRVGEGAGLYLVDVDAIRGGDAESDMQLQSGDVVVVPAAVPVVAGYKVRRALFPVEQLFRTLLGGAVGALAP
jgi:polysaccharide export outer membrane protein